MQAIGYPGVSADTSRLAAVAIVGENRSGQGKCQQKRKNGGERKRSHQEFPPRKYKRTVRRAASNAAMERAAGKQRHAL
jgi:hypothetical protein